MFKSNFLLIAALVLSTISFTSNAQSGKSLPKTNYKIGYAAITWGGDDRSAIKEIAELGFTGIQLRGNTFKEFDSKREELRSLLKANNLEFPILSGGNISPNESEWESQLALQTKQANFAKAFGAKYIQFTNNLRAKGAVPTKEELVAYGKALDRMGAEMKKLGIQAVYHNHMDQLGETPEEVDIILANCKSENIKLLLDVAHYHQGGGDPAAAIRKYKDRLVALHLKDVIDMPSPEKPNGYKFVELGEGKVNLPAIFKALKDIKFKEWAMIELDSKTSATRTAKESAEVSKNYLMKTLK